MQTRNWTDLARKLVDQWDMDFSFRAVQASLGEYALNYFGFGILPTTLYPNPFPLTMSMVSLGGTVGSGIAFDPNGLVTRIDPASPTSKAFTITPAHATLARWDLLVLRYKSTGDTPVPKPSDPILTVNLNLHDDFVLAVIPGTPSATPAYPADGVLDIVLMGFKVPPAATIGTQVILDMSPQDVATNNLVEQPVFIQEVPTGVIDGTNTTFVCSNTPATVQSLLVIVDSAVLKAAQWSIVNGTITLATAPAPGQDVYVYYISKSVTSVNPLAAIQEVPSGTIDGTNDTFYLTGKPAAQAPTLAIVDGRIISADKWSLVQNATQFGIKFTAGNIPKTGQDVYTFYLVNSSTIGAAPAGGGGGGGGAFNVAGSTSSPQVVDPTVGVTVTTSQRQLQFIRSTSGIVPVTANPQISPGTIVGMELRLVGTSDTNAPVLATGNGVYLNGPITLKQNVVVDLYWNGSVWADSSREN
jgi:hypothetical protein